MIATRSLHSFTRKIVAALCVMTVLLSIVGPSPACATQTEFSEAQIKAAFLYRFTSYVAWPPDPSGSGPFIFGLQCGAPVADALEGIVRGKRINGRAVEVRRLGAQDSITDEQILYVGPDCNAGLAAKLQKLNSRAVLSVTDEDDSGMPSGAVINFVTIDGHVRFEVSLEEAKGRGLMISSDLLSVALRVIGSLRSECWLANPSMDADSICPRLAALL
jgi:hypothetical protein